MSPAPPPPRHAAVLTVDGIALRVARVTPTGIEVPLTAGARQQLRAVAVDGRLEAELALVGPDWEAAYVLPFDLEVHEAGRAWLAFAAVDAALARALARFGAADHRADDDPPRRLILPESGAVWAVTQGRRAAPTPEAAPATAAAAVDRGPLHGALALLALGVALAVLALVLA